MGEIETQLLNYQYICNVVVTVEANEMENKFICAYFTAEVKLNAAVLKEYLFSRLPYYMIPQCFIQLDSFPILKNGKTDRNSLPKPALLKNSDCLDRKDLTDMQRIIVNVWRTVIQSDEFGIQDSFFQIGGNSINMLLLCEKLKGILNIEMQVTDLFYYNNIFDFANFLSGNKKDNTKKGNSKGQDRLKAFIKKKSEEN